MTPSKINTFNMFKLPAAFFTGVRVKSITKDTCVVNVKHKWVNQNPFKSMFWAVQGMAAELSTGALIMAALHQSGIKASMLLIENKATFAKKAVGKIIFSCTQEKQINEVIAKTRMNGPQQIWLYAAGVDAAGDEVSSFAFLWSIKAKN